MALKNRLRTRGFAASRVKRAGFGSRATTPGFAGFTPFKAPDKPPPGTYDPQIDAQVRAAGRGWEDTQDDVGLQRKRLNADTGLQVADITQGRDRGMADLTRGRDRSLADTLRAYRDQGVRQGAAAQEQGVAQGGTLAAALAARSENQGRDVTRMNEDFTRSTGRLQQDAATGIERAGLQNTRGNVDLDTTVARAGRENTFFGQDAGEQRFFQAGQSGWDAPKKPANEFTNKAGQTYRVVKKNGKVYRMLPDGRMVERTK